MLLHNGGSHAEYLLIMFAPRVKDVELLPDLQRSDSQPNLALEQFPNMSIRRCACVHACGHAFNDFACLEQHRTDFYKKLSRTCSDWNLFIYFLSFWGVFILQYHAIFMLGIMQKN